MPKSEQQKRRRSSATKTLANSNDNASLTPNGSSKKRPRYDNVPPASNPKQVSISASSSRPYKFRDVSSLPKFLDATGSINAGLFAARRLPELKSLWRSHVTFHSANSSLEQMGNDNDDDDIRRYGSGG
eukprot:13782003-Ditylum_brightwellii.AAC.1